MRVVLPLLLVVAGCDGGETKKDPPSDAKDTGPGAYQQAKIDSAKTKAFSLQNAATLYQVQNASCPPSLDALAKEKLIERVEPDPWKNPWRMTCDPKTGAVVISNGPDGKPDTQDDVDSKK